MSVVKSCLSIDCPERTGGECTAEYSVPMSLRTKDCELNYQVQKAVNKTTPLELVKSIKLFDHWRIIENDFCYCQSYKTSHMLVIKRAGCGDWFEVNAEERAELDRIKREYIYEEYDQIIENCPHRRSVPRLFHFHLMQFHDDRKDVAS